MKRVLHEIRPWREEPKSLLWAWFVLAVLFCPMFAFMGSTDLRAHSPVGLLWILVALAWAIHLARPFLPKRP
jgi:hypothetical protein